MPSHPSISAPDAAAVAERKWLVEALLERPDCDIFRELEELRRHLRTMGFTPRFRSPPPATSQLIAQHANAMYRALEWMDQDSDLPDGFARNTARFLVVGSKTDGFVRYLLEHSPRARGVGVALPGAGWIVSPSNRFELHELDLYDLASHYLQSDPASHSLPFTLGKFDLVILDATPSPRALIAQMLLALHTVHNGGSILFRFHEIEGGLTSRSLIAFSRIADYISVCKTQLQAWSGGFYLHAQTIRVNTPAYHKFKDNLNRLWIQIQTTNTTDPTWDDEDLITPWGEVMDESSMDHIVKLGNPIWGTQLRALYRALGMAVDQIVQTD